MTLTLDHVVIAMNDLELAMADYRELGFTVIYGGRHASGTTHNALICFKDGTYLELLAPTGEPPKPGAVDFSHLLQHGEGVVAYALTSDDLEADAMALRKRRIEVGEITEGGRNREDGVELRWKTALIDGGMSPFLIQDITPRNLRVPDDATSHANQLPGISGVLVVTAEFSPKKLYWYTRLLNTSPIDIASFDRKGFRLGTITVELMTAFTLERNIRELDVIFDTTRQALDLLRRYAPVFPHLHLTRKAPHMQAAHDSIRQMLTLHQQVAAGLFEASGGRDTAYGVRFRADRIPNKLLFDIEKSHSVIFGSEISLSRSSPRTRR